MQNDYNNTCLLEYTFLYFSSFILNVLLRRYLISDFRQRTVWVIDTLSIRWAGHAESMRRRMRNTENLDGIDCMEDLGTQGWLVLECECF